MKTTASLNLKTLKWHDEVSRFENGEYKIKKYEFLFNEKLNI